MGRWQRAPEVLWRSTSLGPVVLAPTADTPDHLGGLGALVWELLDEPMGDDALGSAIAELVPGDGRPTDESIAEALRMLSDEGLVREVAS